MQDIYEEILKFLKRGGLIRIYTSTSNRAEKISFSNPSSFSFLTYIRDIKRIIIQPPIEHIDWSYYLSDWQTTVKISINGHINKKFTQNRIDYDISPPVLVIRKDISIKSYNVKLLEFIQILINFRVPKTLSDIITSIKVPSSEVIVSFVDETLPSMRKSILKLIESAWIEDDKLEVMIKDLYKITPSEFQHIKKMMAMWIRT